MNYALKINAVLCCLTLFSSAANTQEEKTTGAIDEYSSVRTLNLSHALTYALANDPWLSASRHQEQAIMAQSIMAGTLPDPTLTLGLMNLPTNGYAFDQEGMTQFKVSLSQKFSRGDSLSLKQKSLFQSSKQYPWQRADRLAQVKAMVTEFWLNAYRAQYSINLIEKDKELFTQLIQITEASYASTQGKTRQQDIIRAQLELTRLEDKLLILEQQLHSAKNRLAQWLPITMLVKSLDDKFIPPVALTDFNTLEFSQLMQLLMAHPAIVAIEQSVLAKQTQVSLAKQSYKPQIGVNVGYGYRAPQWANQEPIYFLWELALISLYLRITGKTNTLNRLYLLRKRLKHKKGSLCKSSKVCILKNIVSYPSYKNEIRYIKIFY